jgi:hypothetical protein
VCVCVCERERERIDEAIITIIITIIKEAIMSTAYLVEDVEVALAVGLVQQS